MESGDESSVGNDDEVVRPVAGHGNRRKMRTLGHAMARNTIIM